jgi:hypothetical protein
VDGVDGRADGVVGRVEGVAGRVDGVAGRCAVDGREPSEPEDAGPWRERLPRDDPDDPRDGRLMLPRLIDPREAAPRLE